MHAGFSTFCLLFCVTTSYSALSQTTSTTTTTSSSTTPTPTTFQQEAQAAVTGGRSFSAVSLTATAEWTAGSLQESGTAQLQANLDGSTNVQLTLGKASRTEVQTKADPLRTCTWTDATGKSYDVLGPNCLIAIPWFAPNLFVQSPAVLPPILVSTDDGTVSKDSSTFHEVSYLLNLTNANASLAKRMVSQSSVNVFYDPRTFLPVSLEYFIHPDDNDSQNIPVRVVFSNYQSVSGVMLPFHLERYINHTLQLKLDVNNASID